MSLCFPSLVPPTLQPLLSERFNPYLIDPPILPWFYLLEIVLWSLYVSSVKARQRRKSRLSFLSIELAWRGSPFQCCSHFLSQSKGWRAGGTNEGKCRDTLKLNLDLLLTRWLWTLPLNYSTRQGHTECALHCLYNDCSSLYLLIQQ